MYRQEDHREDRREDHREDHRECQEDKIRKQENKTTRK
jgi:hypothetical protein